MNRFIFMLNIFLILFILSCNKRFCPSLTLKRNERINYCKIIDTLIYERYYKKNIFLNFTGLEDYYIPKLIKKTGIPANRDLVGSTGIGYHLDTIFNTDIRAWAKKLGCTEFHLPLPRN